MRLTNEFIILEINGKILLNENWTLNKTYRKLNNNKKILKKKVRIKCALKRKQ